MCKFRLWIKTLFEKHLVADKKSNTSVLDIRSNHCDCWNQRLDIWINGRQTQKTQSKKQYIVDVLKNLLMTSSFALERSILELKEKDEKRTT